MGDSPHQMVKYQGNVQTNVNLRKPGTNNPNIEVSNNALLTVNTTTGTEQGGVVSQFFSEGPILHCIALLQ